MGALIELLKTAKSYLENYWDKGPPGEGWQSDGLRKLVADLTAAIEREEKKSASESKLS